MRPKLKDAVVTALVGVVGVGAMIFLVVTPAYHSSQRLKQLEQAQAADDQEEASRRSVAPTGAEQAAIGNQQEEAEAPKQGRDGLESEDLKKGRALGTDIETSHVANWIAIENLRAAMGVYFISFVVGIASIFAVLGAMFSARDSRRTLRLASDAARARIGIKITASRGNVADIDVIGIGGQPTWLIGVRNLAGDDLRSAGDSGLVLLDQAGPISVTGDVTNPHHGDGVAIAYTDASGLKRMAVFELVTNGVVWTIKSRKD